jgi:hypothetical protein
VVLVVVELVETLVFKQVLLEQSTLEVVLVVHLATKSTEFQAVLVWLYLATLLVERLQ